MSLLFCDYCESNNSRCGRRDFVCVCYNGIYYDPLSSSSERSLKSCRLSHDATRSHTRWRFVLSLDPGTVLDRLASFWVKLVMQPHTLRWRRWMAEQRGGRRPLRGSPLLLLFSLPGVWRFLQTTEPLEEERWMDWMRVASVRSRSWRTSEGVFSAGAS